MKQSEQELSGQISTIPRIARLVAPYVRHELPGWGHLARLSGISNPDDDRWRTAPTLNVRGKWHGFNVALNLADWSERQTYFLGRYHDLAAQLLMDACVRPGERVVDVGANIGMLSLHASSRVGPTGVVDAFEPNPICCERIKSALQQNRVENVRLHPFALADSVGTCTLNILENHTGMGTLASVTDTSGPAVTSSVSVQVKVGDETLPADERRMVFLKIDVEGFEVKALRGLKQTLAKSMPIVATEVIREWIERAGSTVNELTDLMQGLGYESFGLRTRRSGLRHRLELAPCRTPGILPEGLYDAVWLPRSGDLADRLRDLVVLPRGARSQ